MKKSIYSILLLLVFSACGNQSSNKAVGSSNETMAARADSVTLNGYTFAEADEMARSFLKNGFSTEKQTSLWFSKNYIDSLETILSLEGADGIRMYFARNGKKNALVIVSTIQSENTTPTHIDNFDHKSNFFQPGNNPHTLGLSENGVPEARLHAAKSTDCSSLPCNSSGNTISCEQGHRWVSQFNGGPITTSSIWYPIELLHSWKQELDKAVTKGLKGDGIRIYFARNDKNRNILVFTTTRENKKKRTDFYDCNSGMANKDGDGNNGFVADNGEECPNNCNDITWP